MHNLKTKIVVDIFISTIIAITYVVAIDDLFTDSNDAITSLRGCFLFAMTLIGEQLHYYSTWGLYKKRAIIYNTIVFGVQFFSAIIVVLYMVSGYTMSGLIKWTVACMLALYPAKQVLVVGKDIKNLIKYYCE